MGVKLTQYRRGGWEVDITYRSPNGKQQRERRTTTASKSVAQRWGEQRERELMLRGSAIKRKEVPTLKEFAPRFLDGYARANRHKPSGVAGKETILRIHLVPQLGAKKLDAITNGAGSGRRPHAPSYLLLALGHGRRPGARHSGSGGAQGSEHDAALHAPQPGGHGERHPAAGRPRAATAGMETFWRRRGPASRSLAGSTS